MTILFLILIILASFILGFIVLVQNPKGGGLAGTFGGLSNQFMGVKQTTDVLEKGTWIFAAAIAVLSLASPFFIGRSAAVSTTNTDIKDSPAPTGQGAQPSNSVPFQAQPAEPTK